MTQLAYFYLGQGKPSQAEPLAVKGLELARRSVGEETPAILWPMDVVGQIYWGPGQAPGGRADHRQGLGGPPVLQWGGAVRNLAQHQTRLALALRRTG